MDKFLQALTTLVKNFPKQMAPHLMEILPHMWNTLTQSADRYVRTVVNYTEDADDPVDSDGEHACGVFLSCASLALNC